MKELVVKGFVSLCVKRTDGYFDGWNSIVYMLMVNLNMPMKINMVASLPLLSFYVFLNKQIVKGIAPVGC